MDWVAIICLIFLNIYSTHGRDSNLEEFLGDINRRYIKSDHRLVGLPSRPDRFTEEDSYTHLGSSLLRPSPAKFDLERHHFTPRPRLYKSRRSKYMQNHNVQDLSNFLQSILSGTLNQSQLRRKFMRRYRNGPEGNLRDPENLPEAEPLKPGHTLIRPQMDTLKTAANFPHTGKKSSAVYGNMDNLGTMQGDSDHIPSDGLSARLPSKCVIKIGRKSGSKILIRCTKKAELGILRYDKTPYRLQYSAFRKSNVQQQLMDFLIKVARADVHNTRSIRDLRRNRSPYHKTPYSMQYTQSRKSDALKDLLMKLLDRAASQLKASPKRHHFYGETPIVGLPKYPRHLPEAEPIVPGHTLLRPSQGMLKSAVKFPHLDPVGLVYGNKDNIGISYGSHQERVKYTEFRKSRELLDKILKAVGNINKSNGNKKPALVIIQSSPSSSNVLNYQRLNDLMTNEEKISEEENEDASEVLDDVDAFDRGYNDDFRKKAYNYRNRSKIYDEHFDDQAEDNCTRDSDTTSSDSEIDDNPGNPYTIHKNKYKTNWIWNLGMDGNHMNINPYGPQFGNGGPSGADLFFGRKWWYFNQDDYKPFRR